MSKVEKDQSKSKKESGAKLKLKQKQKSKKDVKKEEASPTKDKSPKKDQQKKEKKDKKDKKKKKKEEEENKEKEQPSQDLNEKKSVTILQNDSELATIGRVQKQQQKTKQTIEYLINQYKNASDDIFKNHGHNQEKQRQIEKRLSQLKKQKELRHKKLERLKQRQLRRSEQKQKKLEQRKNRRLERSQQKRRQRAEKKLYSLQMASQDRIKKQSEYKEYYENVYKKKKPRFDRYKQEFEERQQQFEEENQDKLLKRSRKYQPMSQQHIDEFQDEYNDRKWEHLQQFEEKRDLNNKILSEQNEQFSKKLWKGSCHKVVKEEQKQRVERKNFGKQKLQKTKDYGTDINSQFREKMKAKSLKKKQQSKDKEKEREEQFDQDLYVKVEKQKYFKGVNKGITYEIRRKSLSHSQQIQKGNEYLEEIYNLPKAQNQNKSQTTTLEPVTTPPPNRASTFKPKRLHNPYYKPITNLPIPESSSPIPVNSSTPPPISPPKIKNKETVHYILADIDAKHREMALQQKVINFGNYGNVLDVQNRQNKLNFRMVGALNQKLDVLERI